MLTWLPPIKGINKISIVLAFFNVQVKEPPGILWYLFILIAISA